MYAVSGSDPSTSQHATEWMHVGLHGTPKQQEACRLAEYRVHGLSLA
jgi:hypothetical protein